MWVGSLIITCCTLYFTTLLRNYVDYNDAMKKRRAEEIERGEEAAKNWEKERHPRSAPGDPALRALRNDIETHQEELPEQDAFDV